MASSPAAPALAERGDIHKSCKSIETLLNILSEYCEAAGTVVSLQKKLAKALKDAASSKATAEIASNVMLASASVFESLSDVDTKFSKTLDKEYDTISDEVKKSFKKLTKEEKVHDEKMSVANAKIKQAGQVYEKKAKKRTSDANDEHARYINLISTLGPEISQDKYNHALGMSQRHTTMIYSVASCLARLADLEWQKSCECVRRFSPTIGPLGSLRSLCEGGWTGPIPPDLPETTTGDGPTPQTETNTRLGAIEEIAEYQPTLTGVSPKLPSSNGFDSMAAKNQTWIPANPIPFPPLATTSGDTLQPPSAPFVDANTGSVRSLSAFPVPPTHFPTPPLRQQQQQSISPLTIRSSTSHLDFPSSSPLADSPISAPGDFSFRETGHAQLSNSAPSSAPSPAEKTFEERSTVLEIPEAILDQAPNKETVASRPLPHRSQTSLPAESPLLHSPPLRTTEIKPLNLRTHRDRESPTAREFGVLGNSNLPSPTKSRAMDNFKYPRSIERTDTGTSTTGSIVAAMKHRYDNNSGSTSPPRDLPRLPLHVNNMPARYHNDEIQRTPDLRTSSPPVSRRQSMPLIEASTLQARDSYPSGANNSDEERRQRQREDLSRKHKEQELREREVELETRARELERDRARLQALRAGGEHKDTGYIADGDSTQSGQLGLHSRERRVSLRHQLQRPLSRMELDGVDEQPPSWTRVPSTSRALPQKPRTQESHTQHLVPPSSANNLHTPATLQPIHSPKPSHPPSPLLQSGGHPKESQISNRSRDDVSRSYTSTSSSLDHASYCGCQTCSISKYREQPRDQELSPNESKHSEKKRGTGWIRRLSIPVGNMKKHQSSNSTEVTTSHVLGSGMTHKGAGLFSLDSKKNISTTGLAVDEDGKLGRPALGRRSYDFAGMNHRSMTNLNLR